MLLFGSICNMFFDKDVFPGGGKDRCTWRALLSKIYWLSWQILYLSTRPIYLQILRQQCCLQEPPISIKKWFTKKVYFFVPVLGLYGTVLALFDHDGDFALIVHCFLRKLLLPPLAIEDDEGDFALVVHCSEEGVITTPCRWSSAVSSWAVGRDYHYNDGNDASDYHYIAISCHGR